MLEAAAEGLEMEWHYEPAQDLEQPLIERLRNFPRQPDMLVYGARVLAATIIRGWLRLYHRLEIVGCENLPTDRSFILVANHASHLDTLCLLAALPLGKLHRAFNGLCQVIVQAGRDPGEIRLTARSPGLADAAVTLWAAAPVR